MSLMLQFDGKRFQLHKTALATITNYIQVRTNVED